MLFMAICGGIPLSLAIGRAGYVISGIVLTFASFFLCIYLERGGLVEYDTAYRMSFLLPLAISAQLHFFVNSLPAIYYFGAIAFFVLATLMPDDFIGKDPRFPSQW